MAEHTKTAISLPINGALVTFTRVLPKHLLDAIQQANDRDREAALKALQPTTIEEKLAIWRGTGNRYTFDNLGEVFNDAVLVKAVLAQSYITAEEGRTEEDFDRVLGMMDLPLLQQFLDTLTGMDDECPNPTTQNEASTNPTPSAGTSS